MSSFSLGRKEIGPDHPPFIIAEMSGNHNGNLGRAFEIMEAAKNAGADAVKLQTYTADTITIDHDSAEFKIQGGLWDGRTLYELYQEAHTPWEWQEALFKRGRELDLIVFSSPFDETAIDFLETLGCPAYKIASFELVDVPLIQHAAKTTKPLIMSTGMANLAEIGEAVKVAREAGANQIILLHCVSGYPVPEEEADLRTIPDLSLRFGLQVGLSDHTLGTSVAVAAVAMGATIIEKHFTLRRADGGPDSAFSLEPHELKKMVKECHTAWAALGKAGYDLKPSEAKNLTFRRSLYAVENIPAGTILTRQNIRSIRPGYGLSPRYLPLILGGRARCRIARGTPLSFELIELRQATQNE